MRAPHPYARPRGHTTLAKRVATRWRGAAHAGLGDAGSVVPSVFRASVHFAIALSLMLSLPLAAQPVSDGSRCEAEQTAENIACYEAVVRGLLQAWVTASARGDVAAYLALYDRAPLPGEAEYSEASDATRRDQLLAQPRRVISLELESMAIDPEGRADVIFKETIRTRTAETHGRKQLFFDWLGAKLKIRREVLLD